MDTMVVSVFGQAWLCYRRDNEHDGQKEDFQTALLAPLRRRNRECVAKEQCALGRNQLADLHAIKNLAIASALFADPDRSPGEAPAVGGDPDGHCAVAFAHNTVEWNSGGAHRRADANDKIREHTRTQFVLR